MSANTTDNLKALRKEIKEIETEISELNLDQENRLQELKLAHERDIKNAKLQTANTMFALGIKNIKESYAKEIKAAEDVLAEKKKAGKDTKEDKKELKKLKELEKIRKTLQEKSDAEINKKKLEEIKKQAKEAGLSGKAYADAVAAGLEQAGISSEDIKSMRKVGAKDVAKDYLSNSIFGKTDSGDSKLLNAIADFAKQLDNQIDTIAANQGEIDTRLQGSKNGLKSGSYWKQISSDIKSVAAVSPFVKQEAIVEKVKTMVSQGISYNVEQRAFLATISDKIATTFNAADGTLLRLVRLQQQDSTAARLGMESAMTSFLNNMYETTEYMGAIADGVRKSIEEATSLMSAEESIGFEYQVQKWLGSMYSVGMSQSATDSIASALGKLGSGDISGLNGEGMGNLMIMAANNAGLNISELLADGLDESSTNRLMKAMVEYLSGIYDSSKDSKVLQQQFANVYGLTASDLKAIANLKTDTSIIAADGLNYNSALGQLNAMAATIGERTSMGEMLSNMWGNVQYSLAEGIGSNMVTYGLYKAGGMMEDLGLGKITGIKGAMGIGFDTIDVAGIMRTGAMLGGVLGSIGSLASGIGNSFSGTSMLSQLGIGSGITSVARGNGQGLTTTGGASVSVSGNTAVGGAGDITDSAQSGVENSVTESVNDSTETDLDTINGELIIIQGVVEELRDAIDSVVIGGALKVSSDLGSSSWNKDMVQAL